MHKVELLLDDISLGPVNKFLNFCKVLHDEGRSDLLDLMAVNITNVERQLGKYYMKTVLVFLYAP